MSSFEIKDLLMQGIIYMVFVNNGSTSRSEIMLVMACGHEQEHAREGPQQVGVECFKTRYR